MCLYANYVPTIYANYICQLYAYMYTTMCRCNRALWDAADFMGPQLIIFAIAFSWPWTFTSGRKCWVLPRPRNHLLGLYLVTAHKYPSAQGYVQLIAIIMHYHAAYYGSSWCCHFYIHRMFSNFSCPIYLILANWSYIWPLRTLLGHWNPL